MALPPPLIRYVKSTNYVVQPGDHVGIIANRFGMPASRWPELVGANRCKATAEIGKKYRCFRELRAGESLRIPANWRDPGSGLSGPMPSIDLTAMLRDAMIAASKLPNFWPLPATPPTQQNVDPIAQVIASWWAYLSKLPGKEKIPGSFPTSYDNILYLIWNKIVTVENWSLLIQAANSFLTAMGYGNGKTPPPTVLQIPWDTIPWEKIANSVGTLLKSLNDIFASKAPALPQDVTTPTLPDSNLPNFFDPASWVQGSTMHKVANSQAFPTANWNEFLIQVIQDPRYAKCANEAKVTVLSICPQCYNTPSQFLDLLCSDKTVDTICDCAPVEPPTLPPVEPPTVPPTPGTVPGTVPATTEKKDNAFTYAAIGVGVALVGGLLVVISGDKK